MALNMLQTVSVRRMAIGVSSAGELIHLNQISASVLEDSRRRHAHVSRLHRKFHAELLEAFVLFLNVIDLESGERYPIPDQ